MKKTTNVLFNCMMKEPKKTKNRTPYSVRVNTEGELLYATIFID